MINREDIERARAETHEKLPPAIAQLVANYWWAWRESGEREDDKFAAQLADEVFRMSPAELAAPCDITFSHTRHWCGHPQCRES